MKEMLLQTVMRALEKAIPESFTYQIFAPKSGIQGNVGINVVLDKRSDMDVSQLSALDNVVYSVEE